MRATAIADASFCPKTQAAGWAAWVRVDGRPAPHKAWGRLRSCETSSEAEVMAALNGAWIAARLGAKTVLIQSDCMTVLHLYHRKCRNLRLTQLWEAGLTLPALSSVALSVRHVKGHNYHKVKDARTYVNEWCDRHAYAAMKSGYSNPEGL